MSYEDYTRWALSHSTPSYMQSAGGYIPMPQAGGSAPPILPRTGAPVTFAEPPGRLPTGLNAWDVPQKQLPAVRPPVPAVRPPLPAVIPAEASPGMLSRIASGTEEVARGAMKYVPGLARGALSIGSKLSPAGLALTAYDIVNGLAGDNETITLANPATSPPIEAGIPSPHNMYWPVPQTHTVDPQPATPTTQEALSGLEQLRTADPTATHDLWGLHNGQPAQTAQVAPQFNSPDLSGLGSSLPQVPNYAPRVQQAPHRAMQAGRSAHQMGHGRPAQPPVRQQAPQFALGPQVSVQPNGVGGYNVINSQNHLINMSDPDAVRLNQLRQAQVHQTVQQDPRLAQAVTNALNTHPSLTTINGVYQGGLPPHLRRTY